MALTSQDLEKMRDALIGARARGVKTLQMNGERVEYKTDAEMASAIRDLDARIARPNGATKRTANFSSSKGF